MKALVIGATGATGKDLVNVLLEDSAYTEVVIFVRKDTGVKHAKLTQVITDFDQLEAVSKFINGDVWFSCLGTTLSVAGSKENQWHVDYDMPMMFATIAKRNGVKGLVLLSAASANANSRIFYSKMKGKLEDALAQLQFDPYVIFRPGLLLRKNTERFGERVAAVVLKGLNNVGILKSQRPVETRLLAEKLAKAGKVYKEGRHLIELSDVFKF